MATPVHHDRRSFLKLSGAFSAAVLLGACSGGDDEDGDPTTTSDGTPSTVPANVAPLTGLPIDPAVATRPALVVKVDNADGRGGVARPQAGLEFADVVYEEMVEGSVTRFAAVFHSTDAPLVGPVRSGRVTDIEVVAPLNRPLLAWSGGNAGVTAAIRAASITDVGLETSSGAYSRRSDKRAPHNLYTGTPRLFALAPPASVAPPALFTYRGDGGAANEGAAPVGQVHLDFGDMPGSAPVDFSWDAGLGVFVRSQRGTPHTLEGGGTIATPNVVVQLCDYFPNGDVDSGGNQVFQARLVGEGECWVLTNGTMVRGTWSKGAPEAVTAFVDQAGQPIRLTSGRTWVSLVPQGGASVVR